MLAQKAKCGGETIRVEQHPLGVSDNGLQGQMILWKGAYGKKPECLGAFRVRHTTSKPVTMLSAPIRTHVSCICTAYLFTESSKKRSSRRDDVSTLLQLRLHTNSWVLGILRIILPLKSVNLFFGIFLKISHRNPNGRPAPPTCGGAPGAFRGFSLLRLPEFERHGSPSNPAAARRLAFRRAAARLAPVFTT